MKKKQPPSETMSEFLAKVPKLPFHIDVDSIAGALVNLQASPPRAQEHSEKVLIHAARRGMNREIGDALALLQGDHKTLAMAVARDISRLMTTATKRRLVLADGTPFKICGITVTEDVVKYPSKADVLAVMEKAHHSLWELVPRNKGKRATWWKRAGLDHLPQSRGVAGEVSTETKRLLKWLEGGS